MVIIASGLHSVWSQLPQVFIVSGLYFLYSPLLLFTVASGLHHFRSLFLLSLISIDTGLYCLLSSLPLVFIFSSLLDLLFQLLLFSITSGLHWLSSSLPLVSIASGFDCLRSPSIMLASTQCPYISNDSPSLRICTKKSLHFFFFKYKLSFVITSLVYQNVIIFKVFFFLFLGVSCDWLAK